MSLGRIGPEMLDPYKGRVTLMLLPSAFQYPTPVLMQNLLVLSTPIENKAGQ
jgi:hypothetical protein